VSGATPLVQPSFNPGAALPRRNITFTLAGGMQIPVLVPSGSVTVNKLIDLIRASSTDDTASPLQADDFRAVEMAWLSDHLEEVARHYPGEWLAIDGGTLVAHGSDLAIVFAQAAAAGHPDPFVTAVPPGPPQLVIV
jgi:hypothetical protein